MNESSLRDDILAKIITLIEKNVPPEQIALVTKFSEIYYMNVPLEDLLERTTQDLYGALLSHWNLIYDRAPKEFKVRVYNPHHDQDGWQSTHTIIEIACDDMPFLVDSLQMEINRQGFKIYFMIHLGGVNLRRKDNKVIEVLPIEDVCEKDCVVEAPIFIEINRESDNEILHELTVGLEHVLSDVRACVEDWSKMRKRMEEAIQELDKNPPPYDPEDTAESKDFLQWLNDDHFTYLGCRDYELVGSGEELGIRALKGTGLGVLRKENKVEHVRLMTSLPPAARDLAFTKHVLVISKTNTKSTIHRPVFTDYIGVKHFNKQGELIGERRFIGLFTSTAYKSHPKDIPFLRRKVSLVLKKSKLSPKGHSGKELLDILATLPRDDLFQASIDELLDLALGILHIQQRQQIRIFIRQDAYRRFISCLVYVPRELFDTKLDEAIQNILLQNFKGLEINSYPLFSESPLARVHYLIRTDPHAEITWDSKVIQARVLEAARSWKDELVENLIDYYGEEKGLELSHKYEKAFPASYQEDFIARTAIYDIEHIEKLTASNTLEMNLYQALDEPAGHLRFKLFQADIPIILSDVLPMLENMGLRVIDERPYEIEFKDGSRVWIDDFGVVTSGINVELSQIKEGFQEAFSHVWFGQAENDGFNRLVLGANISWREAAILRAYTKYLKQINFTFSQSYIEATLAKNITIAHQLIEIFKLRFDPKLASQSMPAINDLQKSIQMGLNEVSVLDEDRILRRFLEIILGTLRTNYYQRTLEQQPKSYLSFKLDPNRVGELPLPRPACEIFVYSPSVEGVHLRAAKVARGGIRWSDRREDFRTEILGLMKAQQVKNAVIVPAGAKGGFVAKNLLLTSTKETQATEVVQCYQTFICGLLDLTDNLQGGVVVPPPDTVRYDSDDFYLVVAADKGTSTYSDIANKISAEYNYWLGDAFASGGSSGYDHKKMGITARGAWESVTRHFLTLGLDPQKDDFTVVGIGDMSGDVFGNGMLLSEHIKLVAAFNNLYIFLDPHPDPATSFIERKRLFNLPHSNWSDYSMELISKGGGVFSRAAKTVVLSDEIKQVLGIDADALEPDKLISAILTAPVDLLWNGGIGTYVKASYERNADVGDRTNDAVRVNGKQLQCRVVAEGGNLGFSQLGRIEYAEHGGLIYTDFIDNSAGVDCSDHEVNCKILLNGLVSNGDMTLKQRNQLLFDMTDEVAKLVLNDNYQQTRSISVMVSQSIRDLDLYRFYMNYLEQNNLIDRALEFLPDEKTLLDRKLQNKGLTAPEVAILLAYTKIIIKAEMLQSEVLDDAYLGQALSSAFPKILSQDFHAQMEQHRLRREIIVTQLSNAMVNDMGVLFPYRMQSEINADLAAIVRSYAVASRIFSMHEMFDMVEQLDIRLPIELRYQMMAEIVRLIRRAARWFLVNRKNRLPDEEGTIAIFHAGIQEINQHLSQMLMGNEFEDWKKAAIVLREAGVPEATAEKMARIKDQYSLLDIVAASKDHNLPLLQVANTYFAVGDYLEFHWLRGEITKQPVENQWDALARSAIRDDLDIQQKQLTVMILLQTKDSTSMDTNAFIKEWISQHRTFLGRWQQLLANLRNANNPAFIMYSVVIRELVDLMRSQKAVIKGQKDKRKK